MSLGRLGVCFAIDSLAFLIGMWWGKYSFALCCTGCFAMELIYTPCALCPPVTFFLFLEVTPGSKNVVCYCNDFTFAVCAHVLMCSCV